MERDWKRDGHFVARDWKRDGHFVECDWKRDGHFVECDWKGMGHFVARDAECGSPRAEKRYGRACGGSRVWGEDIFFLSGADWWLGKEVLTMLFLGEDGGGFGCG